MGMNRRGGYLGGSSLICGAAMRPAGRYDGHGPDPDAHWTKTGGSGDQKPKPKPKPKAAALKPTNQGGWTAPKAKSKKRVSGAIKRDQRTKAFITAYVKAQYGED